MKHAFDRKWWQALFSLIVLLVLESQETSPLTEQEDSATQDDDPPSKMMKSRVLSWRLLATAQGRRHQWKHG